MSEHPKTVDDIFEDYRGRRSGLIRALTDANQRSRMDVLRHVLLVPSDDFMTDTHRHLEPLLYLDVFYQQCEPERENLCLYGDRDGSWSVDLPSEEVPPELPEPCLGINFARDGMQKRDWLALVAVHSDSWLYAVAFYYGAKLDQAERLRMFKLINQYPTLFEVVTERERGHSRFSGGTKRKKPDEAATHSRSQHVRHPPYSTVLEIYALQPSQRPSSVAHVAPKPQGRLLIVNDISEAIIGREAELFWPDDQKWYMVRIQHVDTETKTARIAYLSGEVEDLNMNEIVRDGHLSLLPLD